MKSLKLRSLQLALLAAAVGLTACKKPLTYVHVKILPAAGGEPAAISDVQLDLDLAGKKTTVHLTNGSAPIQFPTDVTLEVKTGAGQLAIIAICKNASGVEVDRTTGTVQVSKGAIAEESLQLPGGKPDVQPTEASYGFGNVAVGTSSPSVNATFHNAGFKPSGPVSVALGGVGAAAWVISSDGCSGSALPAGGDCTVSLQFNPVSAGAQAATLTFNANPGGSPVIALTGTGVSNPQNLAVTFSGNGTGTVQCAVNGGAATDCATSYNYGDSVLLTAVAHSPDSQFTGWSGGIPACAGTGTCALTMNQPQSVTADFTLVPETLTISQSGNGSGSYLCSVNGSTGAACTSPMTLNYGDSVVVTGSPATGSNFTSWSGGNAGCSGGGTCTVTMTSNQTTTATFTLQTFTVAITRSGSGTVTSPDTTLSCNATTCTATVNYGSTATLNGAASSGFIFVGWSAGACTGTGSCVLSGITSDQGVTASFPASFCAASVNVGQAFGSQMQGCPGKVTYANRATLCGASAHACNANEWVQDQGSTAPTHHYWTDDALNYSASTGACGTAACNTGNCFVSTGNTYTINCGGTTPMHVCAGTGTSGVGDPEGNQCNWTGCGFNSIAPKQFFGGCSGNTTAGALCCSNAEHQYFVSTSGNDGNPGTAGAPFKTITHALAVSVAKDTVFVKTGIYDAANSEVFPLNLPAGVNLIGDEANRGNAATPTKIIGCGAVPATSNTAAVVADAGSMLAGFVLTCPSGSMGLYPRGDAVSIRNNTFSGVLPNNVYGIEVQNSSTNHFVGLNTFTGNFVGLGYQSAATGGKVENNSFTGNAYGLVYNFKSANLGDPANATLSVGNNILSCNTNADLYLGIAGVTAVAAFNKWDHVSPTVSSSTASNQIDIYAVGSSTVNSNSASQAPNACLCATAAVSQQIFDNAMTGCGAAGAPAAIDYASRATLCQAGCHACAAAEWNAHRGGLAPVSNYWTGDNPLNYVSGSTNSCIISATAGTNPCTTAVGGISNGAALVCPNGGACQQNACGLDTTTPQFLGACSTSSGPTNFGFAQGTLCCCP